MKDKIKIIRKITNSLNANDYDSARKYIENDLKRLNCKDEYYFYLALITENPETKKELYTKALEINPDFLDAYINRGLVKNELQDYDGSIMDYDKAIELDSKCALAYNNRGYTKYKKQDYQGALKDYNRAILLNPKFKMAIDNKANLFLDVCLEDDKDFSEKFYLSLGIREVNEGNFCDGLKSLREVLKYNDCSATAYLYLGIAYHNLSQRDTACEYYTKAIECDKNMTDAYFNRGQLLLKTNKKQALDDFVSAVALDSNFVDAYYSIAVVQKELGQYQDALKNLDKVIELEPQAVNAKALKKLIRQKYL